MKRIVALTICLLMVFLCFAPSVSAIQPENTQTEVLENGDSLVSGIGDPLLTAAPEDTPAATFLNLIRFLKRLIYFFTGTKTTVEKSKYLRYYDQNGVLLWEATLTAEFAYSSKQVRCKDARLSFVSLDRNWTFSSRQTEKAGDTAIGTISVKQMKLGVPLQTITRTITLTCDSNGNIN